jgi:AAA+ ATPase superfamily predicted ATPase
MMPQKPDAFVDRDGEWAECARMWASSRPELYVVRGRRRAGKSYLLGHFARAVDGVYYQATKRTEKEQLAILSRIVGRRFNDAALQRVSLTTWEDFFAYCTEKAGDAPFLLVLDEFPYLVDAAPALPSIIQSVWDHELPSTQFKLVLSGSHITAMKRLTEADQPLFGRRTGLVQVNPLGYRHAAEFVPEYSAHDKIRVYGMFGGLPGHLSLIQPSERLVDNVARAILSPGGRLYEEGAHVFDAFVADAAVYNSVVEAIATGESRWSKIANRVGKAASSLSRPIEWLNEMEVIEHVAPLTEYPRPAPKSMLYRLRDPYLQFWYTFVAELRAQGSPDILTPAELWKAFVEPRLDMYIGKHVFELVCRQFVAAARHPALPLRPVRVGSWWSDDASEEVDVVAVDAKGTVLLGECKWGKVGRDDLRTLERRADLVVAQLKQVRSVKLALFSGGGISDAQTRERVDSGEILHFSVEDLFTDTK